jgi:hypothetical protein
MLHTGFEPNYHLAGTHLKWTHIGYIPSERASLITGDGDLRPCYKHLQIVKSGFLVHCSSTHHGRSKPKYKGVKEYREKPCCLVLEIAVNLLMSLHFRRELFLQFFPTTMLKI